MKKTLVAIAALASFGAYAQSSVTLYGNIDIGMFKGANGPTYMDGSGVWDTSVYGIKGSEDLGGGMKASFHLEGGLQANNGTASSSAGAINGGSAGMFNREANVGLSGSFGSFTLGEQLNPLVLENALAFGNGFNINYLVPMLLLTGNVGAGTQGANSGGFFDRNMVSYTTPKMNGFQATLFDGIESNSQGQSGVTASYTSGAIRVGGAYLQSQSGAVTALGASNYTGTVIDAKYNGGKWDLGVAYNSTDWKSGSSFGGTHGTTYNSVSVTGSYAVSSTTTLIGDYASGNKAILGNGKSASVGEVAATYSLSKTTKLYALVQNTKNTLTALVSVNNSSSFPTSSLGNGTAYGFGITKGF